jgi:hypothetical protein
LKSAHSQGKNAIIMDECFHHFTPEQNQLLIHEFNTSWTVKLILNYRQGYELLPSQYTTIHKPLPIRTELMIWPGETNEDGVKGITQYPFNVDNQQMAHLLHQMETKGRNFVSQFDIIFESS